MNFRTTNLKTVLSSFGSGTWGEEADAKTGHPILRSTNIHNGNLVLDNVAYRKVAEKSRDKYKLETGDIIVTSSSGSKHLIGKHAYFIDPNDGQTYLFSNFTYRLKPNKDVIIPKYLYYFLSSTIAKNYLERIQSTTSGLRNLNTKLYIEQEIPIFPLAEQKRIVEILDQADALRNKRTEADKIAERIIPALFYKLFGDPVKDWKNKEKKTIKSLVQKVKRKNPSEKPNEQFNYVDISSIDGRLGKITETKIMFGYEAPSRARQVIKNNDVLISTVRPYLRATALVPVTLDNQICSTGFCVLRSKNNYGFGYLYALSRIAWFTQNLNMKARGASYPAVTDKDIFNITVVLTDNKNWHILFDKYVSNILTIQENRICSFNILDKLFNKLLAQAFSGELTAKWREAHMQELLREMEIQAQYLNEAKV